LSELDSYLCQIFDSQFAETIAPGDPAHFEYDYDYLLRALLKISFNTARAHQEQESIAAHHNFISYILEGGYRPQVALMLQVVTSSEMINQANGESNVLEPKVLRCGKVDYDGPLNHRFVIRMVAINSFWFYIIMPRQRENKAKWTKFLSNFEGGVRLSGIQLASKATNIVVPVNKTTFFHPDSISTMLNGRKVG
jgi:hypothetical protein